MLLDVFVLSCTNLCYSHLVTASENGSCFKISILPTIEQLQLHLERHIIMY